MKKLIILFSIIALLFAFSAPAMASDPETDPECAAKGNFDIGAGSFNYGWDRDGVWIFNGRAGGMSGGIGGTKAEGWGNTKSGGKASADIATTGGGGASTKAGTFVPENTAGNPLGDTRRGVYSGSEAYGITGGSLKVVTKGDGRAGASFRGFAAEGSHDSSMLREGRAFETTTGKTYGHATQGAAGSLSGSVTKAGQKNSGRIVLKSEGEISLYGNTYSSSYRFTEEADGARTEGMGSYVEVNQEVETYRKIHDPRPHPKNPSEVSGRWMAAGSAGTGSRQVSETGIAIAKANGSFGANGNLGCDFTGSLTGYSYTSITSFDGMNGGISQAGAGMSVHTNLTNGNNVPQ